MKRIIKCLALFLAVTIVAALSVAPTVSAESAEITLKENRYYYSVPAYNKALDAVLTSAWDTYKTAVNISAYKITVGDINNVYNYISDLYPEYFYIDISNTKLTTKNGYINSITFAYFFSEAVCDQMRAELNSAADTILSRITSNMTDVDKVVYFHDYISTHNTYDENGLGLNLDSIDMRSFDAYGCLVNHISVCQGMSDAFVLLCQKAGIEAGMVNSDPMCHAWNIVTLGNNSYHLDITWDDTAVDGGLPLTLTDDGYQFVNVNGYASHKNFLKSDSQMRSNQHYSWDADYQAEDSDTYNNYYWDSVYSAVYFIKGSQYFIKDGKIIKRNPITSNEKVLYTIPNGSFYGSDGRTRTFGNESSVLAYDYQNDYLVFNTADGIEALNLYNLEVVKLVTPTQNGYAAGVAFFDTTLYYDMVDYNVSSDLYQTTDLKTSVNFPEYNIIYGDCNDSGAVTISDVLNFKKYLVGITDDFNNISADTNSDAAIGIKDILLIQKYLAGITASLGG